MKITFGITALFLLFFLSPFSESYAQKASDVATQGTCECIERKMVNTEQIHLRDSVYSCFSEVMAVYFDKLRKEYKIKEKNITVEAIIKIRDQIFLKLHGDCKAIDITTLN